MQLCEALWSGKHWRPAPTPHQIRTLSVATITQANATSKHYKIAWCYLICSLSFISLVEVYLGKSQTDKGYFYDLMLALGNFQSYGHL